MAGLNTNDGQNLSNVSATGANFYLLGGLYGIQVSATWGGGNVQLNTLSGDGSTWIAVESAFTANGFSTLDLPPGTYQLAITTATAVYASVNRVWRR